MTTEETPWQPIDTAPRDGTWVLLAGGKCRGDIGDNDRRVVSGQWTDYMNGHKRDWHWQFAWYDGGYSGEYDAPTHWMPLPAHPITPPCAAQPRLINGVTMYDGLRRNDFGSYWEGDAWTARGDAIERRELEEEREHAAMERTAKLYTEMAAEFADNGKTRRWHSLMQRAEHVRGWWHAWPNVSAAKE